MPTFRESENQFVLVPPGEYVIAVYEFSTDITPIKDLNRCFRYNIVFNIENTNGRVRDTLHDHPKWEWKTALFLKACGIEGLTQDEQFSFDKEEAEEKGITFVNPMGLRCHASIVHETYTSKRGKEITVNRIKEYLPDRPKVNFDPALRNKPQGKTEFQ